jgi:hypothetical protein
LILTDGEYKSLIGKVGQDNARWRVFNMAFSELGKRITGLPVDFQIQQQTDANKQFHDLRDALILSDMDERK